MLNKILTILACFFCVIAIILGFWCNLQSGRIDSLKSAKTMLESNNNLLIKKLEKEHNDKLEVSRRAEEIEKAIKADTSGFNWDYDLSGNSVLATFKQLHHK